MKDDSTLVKKSSAMLEHWGAPLQGRSLLIAASALAGSAILHRVGNVVGIAVGTANSGDPQAQFKRTQARLGAIEKKIASIETQANAASFSERETARNPTPDEALER